ncbi:MAG: hypothetical protein Q8R74_06435, partial [Methylophilus sp.]|nr:hypothetical protein [Methylophilus sp.]
GFLHFFLAHEFVHFQFVRQCFKQGVNLITSGHFYLGETGHYYFGLTKASEPTCIRKISSDSGNTNHRFGRENSWINGAGM